MDHTNSVGLDVTCYKKMLVCNKNLIYQEIKWGSKYIYNGFV